VWRGNCWGTERSSRDAPRPGRPARRPRAGPRRGRFLEAPDTPTGEDLLELTAHGSPEILRELVAAAIDAGARAAEPGEFTRRAFTNGRLDLAQAEAVEALIRARRSRASCRVRAPGRGHVARRRRRSRSDSRSARALEARLDHPDEDIAPQADTEADAAFAACVRRSSAFWRPSTAAASSAKACACA